MRHVYAALIIAVLLAGCGGGLNSMTGSFVSIPDDRVPAVSSCSDTDGGVAPETFGTVNFKEGGEPAHKDDGCVGGLLLEWYCDGNAPKSKNVRCPGECKGGVCVTR